MWVLELEYQVQGQPPPPMSSDSSLRVISLSVFSSVVGDEIIKPIEISGRF